MKQNTDAILTFPNLQLQNVNTISSPLTWGFPSITAILGFVHALERRFRDSHDLSFSGVGVVCHDFNPQVSKTAREKRFYLTRNPLTKEGESPPTSEEGRAHVELSLVIKVCGEDCLISDIELQKLAEKIFLTAQTLRIAGGSILPLERHKKRRPKLELWPDNFEEQKNKSKKIFKNLLPGYALICRKELLDEKTKQLQANNPNATSFDSLMEYSSINFESSKPSEGHPVEWIEQKKPGWIVPIAVGYKAITKLFEPGEVINARDGQYPFQFVENIYSIGQWCSPHRLNTLDDIMWKYNVDLKKGLYLCENINHFNFNPIQGN